MPGQGGVIVQAGRLVGLVGQGVLGRDLVVQGAGGAQFIFGLLIVARAVVGFAPRLQQGVAAGGVGRIGQGALIAIGIGRCGRGRLRLNRARQRRRQHQYGEGSANDHGRVS